MVVGQPDQPPLPGLAPSLTDNFRIDKTPPQITGASFTQGGTALPLPNAGSPNITNVSSLSTLSLNVVDVVNPPSGAFGTPSIVLFDALDPSTASNVSNYSLINLTTNTDESQFIASATFVPTTAPLSSGDYTAYTGVINLTFTPGLPVGHLRVRRPHPRAPVPGPGRRRGQLPRRHVGHRRERSARLHRSTSPSRPRRRTSPAWRWRATTPPAARRRSAAPSRTTSFRRPPARTPATTSRPRPPRS